MRFAHALDELLKRGGTPEGASVNAFDSSQGRVRQRISNSPYGEPNPRIDLNLVCCQESGVAVDQESALR
jgi:hypothetical protein